MPVVNRIAALAPEMAGWRRHMHRQPELGYDCHATAAFVAARLREFGVDAIHEGIARSGIVALIEGQGSGPTIGLRADMDALPIEEATGLAHASQVPGVMHACGHDGHTAMLLGAAAYLAETRAFRGRVALIFQPAEEAGSGAAAMVREGIMDRFGIGQVYALHNAPNRPIGHIATGPGPIMAAVDTFRVDIRGRGGHAAMPHETADPIVAAVAMVQAIQTVVSRNHRATDDLVVSVTRLQAGTADNVVPATAWFGGTVRSFAAEIQAMVRRRLAEIVSGTAAAHGVTAVLDYVIGDPATVNDPACAAFAAAVAAEVVGEGDVDAAAQREMGAEDFAHMLAARPGAYLFVGQGDGPPVHHPEYDFNDAVLPIGASLLARLVERAQPPGRAAAGGG
ncbi:MAG: amidohydrolase [Rhodobacteraceae bacterium]|jgi:hippurate hydrolase|nr:amidohydrolase [Paracoccaceae bacterium]